MKSPLIFLLLCASLLNAETQPFALHPDNPHYFIFRGKPTVLITSGEHYGAVINLDFDYVKYLDTLAADSLNHTRLFVGPYREVPGSFGIRNNDLAPEVKSFICAWRRSDAPGGFDRLNKFDLSKWNDKFFERLKDFCTQAGNRGIVIEINLFCPYYNEALWKFSPLYFQNNINGVGNVPFTDVYKMANSDIVRIHTQFTRKIVTELNGFDNIYYEICNEPWVHNVETAWQNHIVETIVDTEKSLPNRHLISLNICNGYRTVTEAHPAVSIFNFHYACPPTAVAVNYHLDKVIGFNETGFAGSDDATYRIQAWQFILAGGGLFNNLDYSFAAGHEDGSFDYAGRSPGGGSAALRKQLKILHDFIYSFDFVKMEPANSVLKGVHTLSGTAYCLAEVPNAYAIYACGFGEMMLYLDIPTGKYKAEWLNTKTGRIDKSEQIDHDAGELKLTGPKFDRDIALRIVRLGK